MYLNKDFLKQLKEERKTYKSMIEFCCDDMILNNYIMPELTKNGFYFETYCGEDYNEEEDYFEDIYQYFIIDGQDAERLSTYTNEIVYYNEELDLYILGVTHCGTGWDYVPSNWKDINEEDEEESEED